MDRLNSFKDKGYHIEKSLVPISVHRELFLTFYDLVISQIQRNKQIQLNFKIVIRIFLLYEDETQDNLLIVIFSMFKNLSRITYISINLF